jgi:hypothetical protein
VPVPFCLVNSSVASPNTVINPLELDLFFGTLQPDLFPAHAVNILLVAPEDGPRFAVKELTRGCRGKAAHII